MNEQANEKEFKPTESSFKKKTMLRYHMITTTLKNIF